MFGLSQRVFGAERLDGRFKAGLVGHWVGGGSGPGWRDWSGYQRHGTFVGSPKWVLGVGMARNAIQTAAGTDQVSIAPATSIDNLNALSISCWVNTSSIANEQGIVEKLKSDASGGWGLVLDGTTGALNFFNIVASGSGATYVSTPTLALNQWYHVAFTLTAQISGVGTHYINGAAVALTTNTAAVGTQFDDSTSNLSIAGRDFDTAGLVGMVDDVRLYNRVLSASEVAMLASPSFLPVMSYTAGAFSTPLGRTAANTHPWTLGMALGMNIGMGGVCS